MALGAIEHVMVDAREAFFDSVIRYLIAGNVLRGNAYPLCVGAERGLQAERLARVANERGATTVAHGCTAAGNDQVRFEVALRTLSPGLDVLAPVRDNSWVREEQLGYLEEHGLPLPSQGSGLLDQSRPLGYHDRWTRNTDITTIDSRGCLGVVAERFLRPA